MEGGVLRNYKTQALIFIPLALDSLATSTQLVSSATPLHRYTEPESGQVSPKPSRFKQLTVRCALGAALLATCLQAGAASALSFNFSFASSGGPSDPSGPITPATVTGIVAGLVDNLNDQKSGLSFTITSSTNTVFGGWGVFTTYYLGTGFDVSGSQITGVNIAYTNGVGAQVLGLGNQNDLSPELSDLDNQVANYDIDVSSANSLVFTPVSSPAAPVPGPLPLFGAAAAFGWSRQLRRRLKTAD